MPSPGESGTTARRSPSPRPKKWPGWARVRAVRRFVIALALLTVGSACDRSPTEPPQPAALSASRVGPITRPGKPRHATVLVPCSALPDQSVTEAIGPEGGSITVGPHVLFIPAGALKKRVSITANIHSRPRGLTGRQGLQVNAVGFQPKLKFQTPAYLVMSYANCNRANTASLYPKHIAYANAALNVILENVASDDYPDAMLVTAGIDHFSNYAVAW